MLTWLDIVLLVIVAGSAVIGLLRGFVGEVMALVVWVAAFWLAVTFGLEVSGLFETSVDSPTARWLLGYAMVFLLVLTVGSLMTWLLRKLVKGSGLSGSDRILGLGFGVLRGAAVASVLVLVAGFTPLPQEAAWQHAQVVPGFERGAEWMKGWLPEMVAEQISLDAMVEKLHIAPFPQDNDGSGAQPLELPPSPSPDPTRPIQNQPGT